MSGRKGKTVRFLTYSLSLIFLSAGMNVWADAVKPVCAMGDSLRPYMHIDTDVGPIEIELYERAAPKTISRLADLVKGPIFNRAFLDREDNFQPVGLYDGLVFNHIKKRLEVMSSERSPAGHFRLQAEIDADALGLNEVIIKDRAQAMMVVQRELVAAHQKANKQTDPSSQLGLWLQEFKKAFDPDFLIGVSRKQVNEALGYVYQTGLDSKPVTRGSVALKPYSRRMASTRLAIMLDDFPRRTGRWMVIGRVSLGLDLVDQISMEYLTTPGHVKPKVFTPMNPVVIRTVEINCR